MSNYLENFENLKKHVQYSDSSKNIKLSSPKNVVMFPFKTRTQERPSFKYGFGGVTGEIVRITLGISGEIKEQQLIDFLFGLFSEDVEKDSVELVCGFIAGRDNERSSVKLLSLNPLAVGDQGSIGEKAIANYILGTLFKDNDVLKSILDEETKENSVLSKLSNRFIDSIPKDVDATSDVLQYYIAEEITSKFKRDLSKLARNKTIFLKYFDMLMNYYYFYYIYSLALMNEFPNQPQKPMYYFVDWETASKNRQASFEGRRNYHEFSKIAGHSYFHINALEHMNILLGKSKMGYAELSEYVSNNPDKDQILSTIKDWILLFADAKSIGLKLDFEKTYQFRDYYSEYLRILNENDKMNPGAAARYSLSFDEASKYYFLKSRGSLGKCLNIKHDFLMLLLHLTVDGRTNLIEMFERFEDIGVFLDKYTKEEIVKYLTKLDLLIKESDSGVAQYVKTI